MSAIVTRFGRLYHDHPDRPVIHLPGAARTLLASDVWRLHLEYVTQLKRLAVERNELVVSAAGNTAGAVALLLACRALGVALMPVDAGTTLPEILDLGMRFCATAIALPSSITPGLDGKSVILGDGLSAVSRGDTARGTFGEAAILKLTSGSTYAPKAVITSESHLIADSSHIIEAMQIHPADTQIAVIPLSHAYGFSVLLIPMLIQGTALVLREMFLPKELPGDARRFNARVFPGVPFMFDYFISHPPADGWPTCLQRLISAGARLEPATLEKFHDRFQVKIHSFYGTTETGGITFDDDDGIEARDTVGRAMPGVTVTLKPDESAPPGAGRVHVESDAVGEAYAGQEEGGFDTDGFLTGDYGAFDERGRLRLLGRASSFLNVSGRKVEPDEVEQLLRSMPGVADVRVLGAPDARRGQQVVACVVASDEQPNLDTVAVRSFCASRLAPYKIPRAVLFLSAIPLTARGKTDRSALDELVRAHLAQTG